MHAKAGGDAADKPSIETILRTRLREAKVNQLELAAHLNRNQPWLHKVLNFRGHVTIDDWIGIADYFDLTLDDFLRHERLSPPSERVQDADELRLLRSYRRIPKGHLRAIAGELLEMYARRIRRLEPPESPAQMLRTPPAKGKAKRKGRAPEIA